MRYKFRHLVILFAAFLSVSNLAAETVIEYSSRIQNGKTIRHVFKQSPHDYSINNLSRETLPEGQIHVFLKDKLSNPITGKELSQINKNSPNASLHLQEPQKAVIILKSSSMGYSLTQLNKSILSILGPGAFTSPSGERKDLPDVSVQSTCRTH